MSSAPILLAIDPGKNKCGLALVDKAGSAISLEILPRANVVQRVSSILSEGPSIKLILGHATTSPGLSQALQNSLGLPIETVDETGSTLAARALYWQAHPPTGWRKIMPLSLQVPPVPIDDFAALVLARRYLASHSV